MEWFEQPDNESCGPTAIINAQRYFKVEEYSFRRLKRLCRCNENGTKKIWMGRVLCEVAAHHGWTLTTCRQVEHLRRLVAGDTIVAIMFVQTRLYPRGHYFAIVDYESNIFTCINYFGDMRLEEIHGDTSEAHIWVIEGKVVS